MTTTTTARTTEKKKEREEQGEPNWKPRVSGVPRRAPTRGPNDCFTAASMYPAGMNFLEPCRGTRTHTPGYMPLWDVTSPVESRRCDSKVSSGSKTDSSILFFSPLPGRNLASNKLEISWKNSNETCGN